MQKIKMLGIFVVVFFCLSLAIGASSALAQAWGCYSGQDCHVLPVTEGDKLTVRCAVEAHTNSGAASLLRFVPRQCPFRLTYKKPDGKLVSKVLSCLATPNSAPCSINTTFKTLGFSVGDQFVEAGIDPVITANELTYQCANDIYSPGYSMEAWAIGTTTGAQNVLLTGPPYQYRFSVLHKYICLK